jgi:1,4-dihydroxy-2-naphthoate octaprenyltransferase
MNWLSRVRPYWLHLRPQSFPVAFVAALTGYALSPARAHGLALLVDLGLLFLLYGVLLWGGTNAFNSGQDGDTGPLNMLPNPPPVPAHLSAFGLGMKLAAVLGAALVSWRLGALFAAAAAASVFYSGRARKSAAWRRGKDVPGLDMAINAGGFGLGSLLVGYCLTPAPLTVAVWLYGAGFTLAYWGGMPTSQLFQLKPTDTGATVPNYTAQLGGRRVLRLAAGFFAAHALVLILLDAPRLAGAPLVARGCWGLWLLLVLFSAAHSWRWARAPFAQPYAKMMRQMTAMMGSQLCWTIYAWLST